MPEILSTDLVLNLQYESIVPRFLELRRGELDGIEKAIAEADFSTLKRLGHNLHGTGSSYGLDVLSFLGAQMEGAAEGHDLGTLCQIYKELDTFLREVNITYRNTILFVDDQPEILALLQRLFPAGEYLCYFASSASEALNILSHHSVDVLVSDLIMPEMGGLELLSIVRQRYPQIVRLVLSGQAQVPSILAAINTGQVFRYLTKPWRVDADARKVIAEAVAYSNEMNHQQTRHLHVALDSLVQVLDLTGKPYLVLGSKNRVEAASADLQKRWALGDHIREDNLHDTGRIITLDSLHSVWIAS